MLIDRVNMGAFGSATLQPDKSKNTYCFERFQEC